jgi:F-type H+-transporting ATPase subunit epsilon
MLKLHVVTPEGPALEHEADEVTLPGLLGEFGILPGHVPLLAAVKAGVLRYRAGAERGRLVIGPGFARADGKDEVSVVVQKSLAADKVSREAAEKLLQDAEARLQEEGDEAKTAVATTDRDWAQAQLDALKAS